MIKRFISKMSNVLETKILKVDPASIHFPEDAHLNGSLPTITDPISEKNLLEAAKIIRGNLEPVAFPTETVYGLGGSSLSDEAVKSIYRAKNRPSDNPLITHVSSIDQLNRKIYQEKHSSLFQNIPNSYHPLISKLWPGPLTILLPVPLKTSALSKLTTADQPTFAVRIPSNPIARALIALSDTPIAAPSANASTRPSPTMASHVYHDLKGRIPLILDGGPCKVGVESTVVDGLSKPPLLLRPGGFTYEQIVELGGQDWKDCRVERRKVVAEGEQVRTPGMKYKHYAPSAKVILLVPKPQRTDSDRIEELKRLISQELQNEDANTIKKLAILTSLHLGATEIQDLTVGDSKIKPIVVKLGNTGEEIQANLFAALRQVDEIDNVNLIFVEGISEDREGLAIMNRLRKAAGDHCVSF
ncbi:hypothetical protein ZYGR_0P01140 [Zygosaccharomyces rouxii]|uniref:Threonylcarbamoyl-AMP synthase n=2 Tax=Zygosaccharomyces rouxii TaxID=4956 RepID=C5E451_ZYGRC|nr:uncharacterized protein ZYRO0E02882g [Zygosaccharomyces rouxii]KAH9198329.1 DHBP synthase RibB-like alpha/beta domain-containing protein [Zygosaccharomyces rouxii]GAV49470.1 hypothetical protein ZYGR_0P01140 [Zygosaccharomyces rouxii]CAR30812.1 ZYRO0E02882p [Zygosaccharomyces rouxii]